MQLQETIEESESSETDLIEQLQVWNSVLVFSQCDTFSSSLPPSSSSLLLPPPLPSLSPSIRTHVRS